MVAVELVALSAVEPRWDARSVLRRAEESGRVALAQRLIERDDRNVRKRCRKATRRSWCRIGPWVLILKAVILG